jgi:hypothetical protein
MDTLEPRNYDGVGYRAITDIDALILLAVDPRVVSFLTEGVRSSTALNESRVLASRFYKAGYDPNDFVQLLRALHRIVSESDDAVPAGQIVTMMKRFARYYHHNTVMKGRRWIYASQGTCDAEV